MLLRIAYCDDEIENGKKIRDYINQLMIQIEVEFELDFYVSGTVLLENVKKQNDYYDIADSAGFEKRKDPVLPYLVFAGTSAVHKNVLPGWRMKIDPVSLPDVKNHKLKRA